MSQTIKNVLVVGSTGGTGFKVIDELLRQGYAVTAFARTPAKLSQYGERIKVIQGDIMNRDDLDLAMAHQDAVMVTIGISENPIRVRLLGSKHTPLNVRSAGTENVIQAMSKHGIKKLVIQSSFGVGESREKLRFVDRLFFSLLLKPQIEDTEKQELLVKGSNTQWTIAQPVHLRDDEDQDYLASASGETDSPSVARHSVAQFMVSALASMNFVNKSVALSATKKEAVSA